MGFKIKGNEWKALLRNWEERGLNKTRWCRENRYKAHQMYYWIEQF